MPVHRIVFLLLVSASLCFPLVNRSQAQGWGTVSGQFILQGDLPNQNEILVSEKVALCGSDILDESLKVDPQTKGIAEIFVYLKSAPAAIHPELVKLQQQPRYVTTEGCRFDPHVLIAQTNQEITFSANDTFMHHVKAMSFANSAISKTIVDQTLVEFSFPNRERLPMRVKCDFHYWMSGWWLILDHPYATVTNEDGTFTIGMLPAGEHHLTIWHERCGYVNRDFTVNINADSTTQLAPIMVDAKRFQEE